MASRLPKWLATNLMALTHQRVWVDHKSGIQLPFKVVGWEVHPLPGKLRITDVREGAYVLLRYVEPRPSKPRAKARHARASGRK